MDMLPQEIAAQLGPNDYIKLCSKVERIYRQKFGVIKIARTSEGIVATVELDNRTRHEITI